MGKKQKQGKQKLDSEFRKSFQRFIFILLYSKHLWKKLVNLLFSNKTINLENQFLLKVFDKLEFSNLILFWLRN